MKRLMVALTLMVAFAGCATPAAKDKTPVGAEQTAQTFFDRLQRDNRQRAFDLLAQGIAETITFAKFNRLMETLHDNWGKIEAAETAVMPFHQRPGEGNFLPLHVDPDAVKRYIFSLTYANAAINCDLTLAPQDGVYKVIWFSFWGNDKDFTPEIREKIEGLFAKPDDTNQ